uniref:Protein E6 n=1 Tax=Human papillomavirus TaxID=10566 RepID=A0A385PQG3_9PAPI|nr:MAG: E6 protein [Human papillomavirus]
MERLPIHLDDFCRKYGISFFDVRLQCVFCKHWISTLDLAAFYCKCLSLIWKDNVCYACCCSCLKLSALYETQRYYQCTVMSDFIEDIVRKPLSEIIIRCLCCLTKLDLVEKLEHKYTGSAFYLVRGYWRGYCRNCKYKDERRLCNNS